MTTGSITDDIVDMVLLDDRERFGPHHAFGIGVNDSGDMFIFYKHEEGRPWVTRRPIIWSDVKAKVNGLLTEVER